MTNNTDNSDFDRLFKIIIIGDSGVGKTSLLLRLISKENTPITASQGIDITYYRMEVSGLKVRLAIWDTAGQERFRTMTSHFYRGAHGALIVYDVTEEQSLEHLRSLWVPELERFGTEPNLASILIGNKSDLLNERVITTQTGNRFAEETSIGQFIETSAKENVNVHQAFTHLVRSLLNSGIPAQFMNNDNVNINTTHTTSKTCKRSKTKE